MWSFTPGPHLIFGKVNVIAMPIRTWGGGTQARQQVMRSRSRILGKSLDLSALQFPLLDELGLDQMISRASNTQGRKLSPKSCHLASD